MSFNLANQPIFEPYLVALRPVCKPGLIWLQVATFLRDQQSFWMEQALAFNYVSMHEIAQSGF